MLKFTILYVIWNDAVSFDDWTDITEISTELAEIHTVGFLVSETQEVLSMALNYDKDNEGVSCMINIPKKWIKFRQPISIKP